MSKQFTPPSSPRKRPRPSSPIVKTEPLKKTKVITSQPCNHEIAGYMPGRGEFETDYGNELDEACIKELQFDKTDTDEEKMFKLAIIDIYNEKLDKKSERKKFIFERNLQDYKRITAEERKKSKEERDLINQMKVFARLMTPNDFIMFLDGLLIEAKLKSKIECLQEYRRAGIRTYSEAHQYEQAKALKFNIRPSLPAVPPPPPLLSLIQPSTSSSSLPSHPCFTSKKTTTTLPPPPTHFQPPSSTWMSKTDDRPLLLLGGGGGGAGRKPVNPIDISESECVHLLSDREKALCSTLRILPKPYLAIKDTLLSEYARTGSLRRRQARAMIKIDVNKTGKIYNFFVEMGWVKQPLRKKS
ncbi:Transcriptional adapter ada2 [Coelomomyces lativittatus]|nr:Transcriptional adapter ada2 [Coelomomyces lativittatus]KAJ1506758.1 Transcriptional adapter ada2 [Coelomomyces lativittatus]